jgi:hypothetical protein
MILITLMMTLFITFFSLIDLVMLIMQILGLLIWNIENVLLDYPFVTTPIRLCALRSISEFLQVLV